MATSSAFTRLVIGPMSVRTSPSPSSVAVPREDFAPTASVEFVLIAEAGILEAQALMLCESIREFGGRYSSAAITVVSPRGDRRPSRTTVRRLQRLGTEFLPLDLRSRCPEYGPSHKVLSLAYVARRPGPPILVQVDSDTVFLRDPDFSLNGVDAAARPVDVKGMCTSGPGDPFDPYWRSLCRLCEVEYDQLPMVKATVDRQVVRASYNGGLVAARRATGIFERTEEFFNRVVAAELKPWGTDQRVKSGAGLVGTAGGAYWAQAKRRFRWRSPQAAPPCNFSRKPTIYRFTSLARLDFLKDRRSMSTIIGSGPPAKSTGIPCSTVVCTYRPRL